MRKIFLPTICVILGSQASIASQHQEGGSIFGNVDALCQVFRGLPPSSQGTLPAEIQQRCSLGDMPTQEAPAVVPNEVQMNGVEKFNQHMQTIDIGMEEKQQILQSLQSGSCDQLNALPPASKLWLGTLNRMTSGYDPQNDVEKQITDGLWHLKLRGGPVAQCIIALAPSAPPPHQAQQQQPVQQIPQQEEEMDFSKPFDFSKIKQVDQGALFR